MGLGTKLKNEILDFGILVMLVVVLSVVLLKMRVSNSVACTGGYIYNSTLGLCHAIGNAGQNSSTTSLFTDVGTYVTAFSEPKNWVSIVIIALIAIVLIKLFTNINKGKGR